MFDGNYGGKIKPELLHLKRYPVLHITLAILAPTGNTSLALTSVPRISLDFQLISF